MAAAWSRERAAGRVAERGEDADGEGKRGRGRAEAGWGRVKEEE